MTGAGLDLVVLTGFLGSGKTTLLREFLLAADDAADTALIVNEVGEIGLDGAILREAGGDVAMTTLSNGCICCQIGSDLTLTLEALLAAPRPDPDRPLRRIVIETSGLSKPGPILRQLAQLAAHRMRIAVMATYDALRGPAVADFEEAAAQWAGAHRIVLTKTDLVSPERRAEAAADAAAINPLAEIVGAPDRAEAVRRAFAPMPPGGMRGVELRGRSRPSHSRISCLLLRQDGSMDYDDLAAWLDNLAGLLGEKLLRLKGLVEVRESEAPLLVQSVGTLFSQPRPYRAAVPDGGPFLVLIARDLEPGMLDGLSPRLPLRMTSAPRGAPERMRAQAV